MFVYLCAWVSVCLCAWVLGCFFCVSVVVRLQGWFIVISFYETPLYFVIHLIQTQIVLLHIADNFKSA